VAFAGISVPILTGFVDRRRRVRLPAASNWQREATTMDDAPMALDDFRVMAGVGRVILALAVLPDGGGVAFVKVGITAREARELAADLIARAERVEGERAT